MQKKGWFCEINFTGFLHTTYMQLAFSIQGKGQAQDPCCTNLKSNSSNLTWLDAEDLIGVLLLAVKTPLTRAESSSRSAAGMANQTDTTSP